MKKFFSLILILVITFIYGCDPGAKSEVVNESPFNEYWFSGTAEISSYNLKQARYGEVHDGYAVLVFVTEDFSRSKQVKLDDPYNNPDDAEKVLKLNYVKKFNTGIYRYSIMESIFTPVDIVNSPNSLKISFSSQEWCGNTYTQLNLKGQTYLAKSFSYFEKEGDNAFSLRKEFLEDEIWNRIRINPDSLPTGEFNLIPSLFISRLKHIPLKSEKVSAELTDNPDAEGVKTYRVEFPATEREFKVDFSSEFPHEILSWEEKYISGFGSGAEVITTTATLNKSIKSDYWNKNSVNDVELRKELGIE